MNIDTVYNQAKEKLQSQSELEESFFADHPWGEKVKAHNFTEASKEIEDALNNGNTHPEVKLCWVKCQLALNAISPFALSTPLEETFSALKTSGKIPVFASLIYLDAGRKLMHQNHFRVAVKLLEHSLELCKESAAAIDIKTMLREVIRLELERAQKNRESKSYVVSLEKKLAALHDTKPTPVVAPHNIVLTPHAIPAAQSSTAKNSEEQEPSAKRTLMPFLYAAALFCFGFAAYSHWKPTLPIPTNAAIASAKLMHKEPSSELTQPTLPPASSLTAKKFLSHTLEKLKKLNESSSEQTNVPSADLKAEAAPPKETDIPIQDTTIAKVDDTLPPQPTLERDFSKTTVETVGSTKKKVAVEGIQRTPDGRRYGPNPNTQAQDLDGRPLRSYEVQQFNPPLLYRTITPTHVSSSPSIISEKITDLGPNVLIKVYAKMGQWLEIRSSRGELGYVLAQDAAEHKK